MNVLTDEQAATWCKDRGFYVDTHFNVRFRDKCRVFDVTGVTPDRAVYLGAILSTIGRCDNFAGALVWYREWEQGDYPIQRKIMERIRLSYGAEGWPIEKPGHHFNQKEETDAGMFVALLILFQWEGYCISEDGNYMVYVKADDEALVIASHDKPEALIDALNEFYKVRELDPQDHWYQRMVSGDTNFVA